MVIFRHAQSDGRAAARGQVGVGRLSGVHRQAADRPATDAVQRARTPLPLQQAKARRVHAARHEVSSRASSKTRNAKRQKAPKSNLTQREIRISQKYQSSQIGRYNQA